MLQFILNEHLIKTDQRPSMTLLDFIRYQQDLKGTKIGCREGDCGACTVLIGELVDRKMYYESLTSCLTPLGNAQGKHVVTVEGINMEQLSPFQQAIVDESGSQCGFCTVGFVMSFAGECMANRTSSTEDVISSIDGNICRCTGYKSLERAAESIYEKLKHKSKEEPLAWLVENSFIPRYFKDIPKRLTAINNDNASYGKRIVGGGTDLYVQRPDEMFESELSYVLRNKELQGVREKEGQFIIGAASSTSQIMHSPILQSSIPKLREFFKLISSTPIRNIATLGGNLVNASPIGDLSIFFLALNSKIHLENKDAKQRQIPLKDFFKDYKVLNKQETEIVTQLQFTKPGADHFFNFEKVCKRQYLDIASVNSAISLNVKNGQILDCHLAAGGVAPVPKYLDKTSRFLETQPLSEMVVVEALQIMDAEISPISDIRGSADYKRLLLRQLVYGHFMELFPEIFKIEALA